jgi:hypothetical protein
MRLGARRVQAFATHLLPHLARAVHLTVLIPDPANNRQQDVVALRPRRAPRRIPLLGFVSEVCGRGDRQHAADRLDPKLLPMIVDERARSSTNWRPAASSPNAKTRSFRATGKSHLAQAIGRAVIRQGSRAWHREAHVVLEELADATLDGIRKDYLADLTTVSLLIIDDLGMRKLPHPAAEDLLEVIMRRYERASTLLTSNRPVGEWGKLLSDTAAVMALLDRLLHHAHVLKCGPRSRRTKLQTELRSDDGTK